MKETSYELLKDELKKQLGKNNEVKMTLYNSLACKDPKSLDLDYSSKNYLRNFLRALPLKWRAKVTTIKEAKYLATLPLDKLVGNLKVIDSDVEINLEMVVIVEGHFASECTKPKENKAFVGRAWSDSEDGDEL
ncbi:hypothetical protein Tco_0676413 [Tanacetum coccineum]